ncbi:glucose repressible protein mak10 [Anaeramoeba flamelloides]|uniref:Glucose repressible protein mak10 n=1 Tax=Anaeramoeba flamelloides TaxID=1746091 RepID=A0AAV7YBQ5_9EUKA|nr:glucose repressible protein mak10 [Anaeramoeba flamelloides]
MSNTNTDPNNQTIKSQEKQTVKKIEKEKEKEIENEKEKKEEPKSFFSKEIPLDIFDGPKEKWEDISKVLSKATSDLKIGQMIHKENFILDMLMTVPDIGVEKMDAGVFRDPNEFYSIDQTLGKFPLENIEADQLLGVMDQLFCAQMTYLSGENIAQSMYSCFYLQYLDKIECDLLKQFCLISLKFCSIVRTLIITSGIHQEGEYFIATNLGYNYMDELDVNQILPKIATYERQIKRKLKGVEKQKKEQEKKQEQEQEQEKEKEQEQEKEKENSKKYLDINIDLTKIDFQTFLESLLCRIVFQKKIVQYLLVKKTQLSNFKQFLNESLSQLQSIISTNKYCTKNVLGFYTDINRRKISPPAPVKKIELLTFEKSIELYQQISNELLVLCDAPKKFNIKTKNLKLNRSELSNFFDEFNKKSPNILSRALISLIFFDEDGFYGGKILRDLILNSLVNYSFVDKSFLNEEPIKKLGEALEEPILKFFLILCNNRGRSRRNLSNLFENWEIYVQHGTSLDHLIILKKMEKIGLFEKIVRNIPKSTQSNRNLLSNEQLKIALHRPISSWMLDISSEYAIRYIKSGFELDLFSIFEYASIYWYLAYLYLIKWQSNQAVKTIQSEYRKFELRNEIKNVKKGNDLNTQPSSFSKNKRKGKGKGKGKGGGRGRVKSKGRSKQTQKHKISQIRKKITQEGNLIQQRTTENNFRFLYQLISKALTSSFLAFEKIGAITIPENSKIHFASRKKIFKRRILSLSKIINSSLNYQKFIEAYNIGKTSTESFFKQAIMIFDQALNIHKKIEQKITQLSENEKAELGVLKKIIFTNKISLKLASDMHSQNKKYTIEPRFNLHKIFPTIGVK